MTSLPSPAGVVRKPVVAICWRRSIGAVLRSTHGGGRHPVIWRMTPMMGKHILSLAIVMSLLALSLGQAEDQPLSGPPDMLALYLTHIDAKSLRLVYPEQHKTYTLRITPQTIFCHDGKREKSWEYLRQHIGTEQHVITVKTSPDQKVALVIWNTGPLIVTQGTEPMSGSTRLDFPESCVQP